VSSTKIKVVVDAMGGDYAPKNVVLGTYQALQEKQDQIEIILCGDKEKIIEELKVNNIDPSCFTIEHAPDTISFDDHSASSVKSKTKSSIVVGITQIKEKKADVFISAGSTGAVVVSATLTLGRLKGISRPTIEIFLPSEKGPVLIIDAGANAECKPQFLYEFAIMGSIFIEELYQHKNPSIGLLSIGEERSKGNSLIVETNNLLKNSKLNFIGNIEGNDILGGKCQIVICDGFVGNIVLKLAESFLSILKHILTEFSRKTIFHKIWAGLIAKTLKKLLVKLNYEETGGATLLGVNGIVIIGHGKSTPKAIKSMIFQAEEMYKKNINKKIEEKIKEFLEIKIENE
jgi:glycerol-3-phosphate acyltransferase PlsX